MKKLTKLATAALLTMTLMTVSATQAGAQQSIEQNATVNQTCTTGAYGTNNCSTVINQNATNQYVQRVNGAMIEVHDASQVEAGMDTNTMLAAVATLVTTTTGAFISYKSKMA